MKLFTPKTFITVIFLLLALIVQSQSLNIISAQFDTGPYARNSSIFVPLHVHGSFKLHNKFELYLSEPGGTFGPGQQKIGEYNSFFAPFINGMIPSTVVAGTYKLKVVSTLPALSAETPAFTINASTSQPISPLSVFDATTKVNDTIYGRCKPTTNYPIYLTNSTAGSFSATLADSAQNLVPITVSGNNITVNTVLGNYYRLMCKVVDANGNISTRSFLVLSSTINLSLQTSGNNELCLPERKSYTVNVTGNNSIKTNYPGSYYIFSWGDGTNSDTTTHFNLLDSNGVVSHIYNVTSCGKPAINDIVPPQYNAFKVTITGLNPFCDASIFTPLTTYAKVFAKPVAKFSYPRYACVNTPVTFTNVSDAGISGANNAVNCSTNVYSSIWFVDGFPVSTNKDFTYTFTTIGEHQIKLEVNNGTCVHDTILKICIEPKPVPDFNMNGVDSLTGCAPLSIGLNNQTNDNPCRGMQFQWSIIDKATMAPAFPSAYEWVGSDTAKFTSVKIKDSGSYYIQLAVTNSCGVFIKRKPVTITASADVTMPVTQRYCDVQTINFATNTKHTPIYSTNAGNESFQWTITGGAYNYTGGTSATSKYPIIQFLDYATYIVQVKFINDCGTITKSQAILFDKPAKAVINNALPVQLCYSVNTLSLSADTSGSASSILWTTSGTGNFSTSAAILNPTYNITTADKNSGTVTLKLITTPTAPTACNKDTAVLQVAIRPDNYLTNAVNAVSICSNQAVNFTPVSVLSGSTFSYTSVVTSGYVNGNTTSGNGSINDVLVNNSGSVNAVVTYTITPQKDGCNGQPFTLTVTIKPTPTFTVNNTALTICSGQPTGITLNSVLANATYTWNASLVSGTATGYSSQTLAAGATGINQTIINTGTTDAVISYTITVYNPATATPASPQCEGETKTVTITVKAGATVANAGNDQKLCNQTQTTLAANTAVVGTGAWSIVSGTGITITDALLPNTIVTGLQPDKTYILKWTITAGGGCPPTESNVTIYNRANTTVANAGTDKFLCDFTGPSATTSLAANAVTYPAYETGTWSVVSGTGGSINQVNNPTSAFVYTQPGTYTLKWKIINDACPSTESNVNVHVYAKPVVGIISTAINPVCFGSNVAVTSLPSTGVIEKWQIQRPLLSGTWNDTAITASVINVNNVQSPFNIRMVVASDGGTHCTSKDSSNIITVNVSPLTVGGTTSIDTTLCKGSNATIQLTGNTGTVLYWEKANSLAGPYTQIAATAGLQAITENNLQTTTYYRAVVKSGACNIERSSVTTIAIADPVSSANAGADQKLCNASAFTLNGNIPANGTGAWQQIAGPSSTIVNASSATTAVNGIVAGNNYTYVWKITGLGNCPPSTDTVLIFNRPLITQAIVENDKVVCDFTTTSNNSTTISANIDATRSYEQGAWTVIQKPVTATVSFANVAANNTIFNFSEAGTYKLEWRLTNDAGCTSTADTLTIKVYNKAVAGTLTVPTVNVCYGQDVTVTLPVYTGVIQKWQYKKPYTTAVWKDTMVGLPSVTFLNVTDSFEVRAVVVSDGLNEGCSVNAITNPLKINVAPVSVGGNTNADATVCSGSNSGTITLANQTGAIVKWQYSENGGGNWTDISNTSSFINYNNITATRWYRAVVQSGVCTAVYSDTTVITVKPAVNAANAGADLQLCNVTATVLNANTPSTGETGLWNQLSGPAVTLSALTNPLLNISNMTPGTYRFEWSLTNNTCPATKDTVQIINYPQLTNTISGADQVICFGQSVQITGNTPTGGNANYVYQWQQSANGTVWTDIAGANTPNLNYLPTATVYIRRYVIAGPCENASNQILITVQPPITNNSISVNHTICYNTAASLITGSLPAGADGLFTYKWESSADGISWNAITGANGKDYNPGVLTQTTHFRRVVSSALCTGAQANISTAVIVTVNPDAKAIFTYTKNAACPPFNITSSVIQATAYPDRNIQYLWYANNVLIGTDINFPGHLLVNSEDSVTIKLKAISLYGCKNDSISYKFYTFAIPQTSFTASDTVGCGPITVTFTNTTPQASRFNFYWDFGNGVVHSGITPPAVTFNTNPNFTDTIYKVTLNGYTDCDTIKAVRFIRVKSKPKSLFTPDKTFGCSPFTVNFTNTSKGNNISYTWMYGDGNTFSTNNQNAVQHTYYTGMQDTVYARLRSANECGADTATYAIVISPNTVKLNFAINGNQLTGCNPQTIQFINNSSGASSFKWDFGDGNILNTTKNIDTVTHVFNKVGTFTVKVFASNGCSDTATFKTITVFAKPVVNFNAIPLSACIGDTIQFQNLTDTSTGLLWRFKDGYTSNLTNPVHVYQNAGVYQVTLVASRQYNIGNVCVDSITKPISIVAKQQGLFVVSDSVGNCAPFTVTVSNLSLPSSLTTWDFGDGKKDTGNVLAHTYTAPGTYFITMTALHPGGCKYEMIKKIVVNAPTGTWQYDHGFICGTNAVKYQASVANVDSIRWNFGDGKSVVTTVPVVYHSYTQPGYYIPSIELMAGATCKVKLASPDTIKVDDIQAGFKFSDNKICGATTYGFNDTSRAFFGLQSYAWNFGDNTSSTQKNPQHNYTATAPYNVELIVKGNSGCTDTVVTPVSVLVKSLPVAAIDADTVGCTNNAIAYTANVNSFDAINLYSWSFTNGASANGAFTTNIYGSAGLYQAKLIVGTVNGCYDTITKNIRIYPKPNVVTNNDQLICKGASLQLNTTGATTYTWTPTNGLSCINCPNPKASPETTTQYFVIGTNSFGCSAKDSVTIKVAQPIDLVISENDTICIGQTSQLHVNGATTYLWSPAATLDNVTSTDPVASPTVTTKYRVIGFDEHNCFQDTGYVTVAVGQYPTVKLPGDTILATGTQYKLTSVITNGPIKTWEWSPANDLSCNNCPQPVATIKTEGCYTVKATNMYGCAGYDTTCVKVFCKSTQVFIPNAFSPGHTMNNILMVRGSGIQSVKSFRIFNRWGQVVFERANFPANAKEFGWDGTYNGKQLQPDVFIYTAEVICDNGTPYTFTGNVAILK